MGHEAEARWYRPPGSIQTGSELFVSRLVASTLKQAASSHWPGQAGSSGLSLHPGHTQDRGPEKCSSAGAESAVMGAESAVMREGPAGSDCTEPGGSPPCDCASVCLSSCCDMKVLVLPFWLRG